MLSQSLAMPCFDISDSECILAMPCFDISEDILWPGKLQRQVKAMSKNTLPQRAPLSRTHFAPHSRAHLAPHSRAHLVTQSKQSFLVMGFMLK